MNPVSATTRCIMSQRVVSRSRWGPGARLKPNPDWANPSNPHVHIDTCVSYRFVCNSKKNAHACIHRWSNEPQAQVLHPTLILSGCEHGACTQSHGLAILTHLWVPYGPKQMGFCRTRFTYGRMLPSMLEEGSIPQRPEDLRPRRNPSPVWITPRWLAPHSHRTHVCGRT